MPSAISCKRLSCLKTWPICWRFLWQIEFSTCLSYLLFLELLHWWLLSSQLIFTFFSISTFQRLLSVCLSVWVNIHVSAACSATLQTKLFIFFSSRFNLLLSNFFFSTNTLCPSQWRRIQKNRCSVVATVKWMLQLQGGLWNLWQYGCPAAHCLLVTFAVMSEVEVLTGVTHCLHSRLTLASHHTWLVIVHRHVLCHLQLLPRCVGCPCHYNNNNSIVIIIIIIDSI